MMYLAWYFGVGVLSFCILFSLYAVLFSWRSWHEHNQTEASKFDKGVFYTLFVIGYIGDVLWRWVYGTILLWKLPMWDKDQTLTKLLNWVYRNRPPSSRTYKISYFIGMYLLNPHDDGHYGD